MSLTDKVYLLQTTHLVINAFLTPCTTAEVYKHDSAEDHEGGQYLLPTEGVHSQADADGGGDDGLHVGVHAYQCGTDALLTNGDEEVSDESGAHDEVGQLEQEGAGEG